MSNSGETGQELSTSRPGPVLAALLNGGTLLTPSVRAARLWAGRYDDAARQRGERSWQAARILPWRAWTAALWQDALVKGLDSRVLLNDLQERALWRGVISAASAESLESADAHARLSMEATRLLGSYDVDARFADGTYAHDARTADAATFQRRYAAFEQVCAQGNYLPASYLEIELATLIRKGQILRGGEFLLCGLDSPSPAQLAVLAALQATGATVRSIAHAAEHRAAPRLLRCESGRGELQHCATWARRQLELHPERGIGIVVPDLPAVRAELERELRSVVAPETADVTRPASAAPYEFSAGRALTQLPIVRDALRLLEWCARDISVADAGALLRSRYLTLAGSPEAGAELDVNVLRKLPLLRRTLSVADAAAAFKRYTAGDRMSALEREARRFRAATETFAWFADGARTLLEGAGWPGPAELQSDEFQAVDRWNEVLDTLASLDLLGIRTDFAGFVGELLPIARDTLFAPENLGAPVQVMTPAEASGSAFDDLWFLHAHANTWPPRPRSHALLPWRLQNDLHMPGTDPARDEAAARAELFHLIESAKSASLSWSPDTADEAAGSQRPSPLVERVVEQCSGSTAVPEALLHKETEAVRTVIEPDVELLPQLMNQHVSGGVGLLKAQAQCGFRAFAEKRLFAAPMEQQDAGFSPGERGEQVHRVLERFWNEVKDQRTLRELGKRFDESGSSARDNLLRKCIAAVFSDETVGAWESSYLQVQQERLFRLLSDWLTLEAERHPFEVLCTEKQLQDVPVGPLLMNMRVDRVDKVFLPGGEGTVLIDYKTGPAEASQWLGERPDEPQLPVYAVAGASAADFDRIDGIAFAGVRVGRDNLKLEGLGEPQTIFRNRPRKAIPFDDQLEVWHTDLNRLAAAFAEGDAAVDPKEYPATCDRCAQRMLCRVDAAALLQIDALEETEGEEATAWS